MEAQIKIRQEAQEKQEVLADLLRWAPETQKRPGTKSATSIRPAGPAVPGTQEGIAPLRSRRGSVAEKQGTAGFAPNTLRESVTVPSQASNGSAASHTYDKSSSKWDKFDYDSALAQADDENHNMEQSSSLPKSSVLPEVPKRASKAPVKTGMEPRQQNLPVSPAEPTDAELWKDRGNIAFSAKNYAQAKKDYTQSIALQPTCLAYANRAMAELKLEEYSATEADCTTAIALDAAYTKAYLRRAAAAKQLGKLLQATEDYEHALRLEPTSKAILADRRSCLDQLLLQQGLQNQNHRVDIPIGQAQPQTQATINAVAVATTSRAQPSSMSQVPNGKAQQVKPAQPEHTLSQSRGHAPTAAGSTGSTQHSEASTSPQKPGKSALSSADKPTEAESQQSKPSSAQKKPDSASQQKSRNNSQDQNAAGHVPYPGRLPSSLFGMAPQQRRKEPSVVIEELPLDEEDLFKAKSQGSKNGKAWLPSSSAAHIQPNDQALAQTPQQPQPATSPSASAHHSTAASVDPIPSTSTPTTTAATAAQDASVKQAEPAKPPSRKRPANDSIGTDSAASMPHKPAASPQATPASSNDAEAGCDQGLLPESMHNQTAGAKATSMSLSSKRSPPSPAAAAAAATQEPAAEQHGLVLPVKSSTDTHPTQQKDLNDLQPARLHGPMTHALHQCDTAELPAQLADDLKLAQQDGAVMNGGARTGLAAAQMNGRSATQAGGHPVSQQHTGVTAASKEQKLQAAAVDGASAKSQAAATAGLSLPTPRSGTEFEVSWKRLKGNAAGQEEFLRQLDPMQLPALFKQSLTAPVLSGIALAALNMIMAQNDHFGIQLLENLTSVPRFNMIVMSLPRQEKSALKEHYAAALSTPVIDSVLAQRLEKSCSSYRV